VVDAAGTSVGLWFSYLFLFFYLLVAVGGVTQRDLLLGNPIKLPFLNVELPMVGFFWIGPAIFLIVHAHVLLNFALLAGKVRAFDQELESQVDDTEMRRRLRWQLPSNIFVQALAGPGEVREGLMGFMLRLIARISLVVGPILLLIFFELQFLPYHHSAVSWCQRVAVVADLALLWMLWPSIAGGKPIVNAWRVLPRRKIAAWGAVSFAMVLVVFTVATFPGELLDKNPVSSLPFVPTKWPEWPARKASAPAIVARPAGDATREFFRNAIASVESMRWISLHSWLVAGKVEPGLHKPTSLFSNRLVLSELDAIDRSKFDTDAKIAAASETVSLRRRDFRGAVLTGAILRKADFTAANLQDAYLDGADLREARFGCEDFHCADLQGARLQDANLSFAQLQGANLEVARLQGAGLARAQLQGASLRDASMEGADLYGADLQGADLGSARLQAARLTDAQLQAASLMGADLHGAVLRSAHLEGAVLFHAHLEGARLYDAQLQGADLGEVKFQYASLERAFVWRTFPFPVDNAEGARIVALQTGRTRLCEPTQGHVWEVGSTPPPTVCAWSAEDFAKLKQFVSNQVPQKVTLAAGSRPPGDREKDVIGNARAKALAWIEGRLDPNRAMKSETEIAKIWADLERSHTTSDEVYATALGSRLLKLGCAADRDGAPYVIVGLLRQLEGGYWDDDTFFAEHSQWKRILAKAFLDEEHCTGARGLTDDDKERLEGIIHPGVRRFSRPGLHQ
jgi:uncharacterized protein YjbI with pentapeptide repeats